uniref:Uncharacterized protein n=2 Tax=Anopheles atroparvus TaxID=41427 RepID=A0A182IUQ6_ANOAO
LICSVKVNPVATCESFLRSCTVAASPKISLVEPTMKCIVALVLVVATALCAEGSVIPLALAPGYTIAAPAGLAIPGATVIQSNPPPALIHALAIHGSHAVLLAPAPGAPAVVALAPPPAATSVSVTRGAVHVAPLPGHTVSQTQLNLAAAPGTE